MLVNESVPKAEYEKVVGEREQYRQLYLKMIEQCRKLELGLLGQKAERLSPADTQLTMAVLAQMLGESASADAAPASEEETEQVKEYVRQKPTGRKPLPENLPRVEIEILPEEVQREGLDAFERIGEDLSETVERRPGTLVVVRVRRPKFVRKDRERCAETKVSIAETPDLPIDRGLAGPALLADSLVRRWQDHLPLYRLEQIYAREGIELARSTICGWHGGLAALAKPVVTGCGKMHWPLLIYVPMQPAFWCKQKSGARRVTSGSWSRPSGTCSTPTRKNITPMPSTKYSPTTRGISSPTRTRSTIIYLPPVT